MLWQEHRALLRPSRAEGEEFVFAQCLPRHAEEDLFFLLEMSARDLNHLFGKGAGGVEVSRGFDFAEHVPDLVVFHAHDGERSACRAEVWFEGVEEQFVFETRVGFEGEGKGGDSVLEIGEGVERGDGLLDVAEHEMKYGVFAEEGVCD